MTDDSFVSRLRWRNLPLAQKVTLAMVASLVPIVAVGWWVASFASGVLAVEVQENVGRAGEVQSERVNASILRTSTFLGTISNGPEFRRAVDLQGTLSNTSEAATYFQTFVDEQYAASRAGGMVGVGVITIGGGEPKRAGELSPETVFLRTQFGDEDVVIGEAFLADDGDARLPVAVRVRGTENGGGSVTVVAEWTIDELVSEAIDPANLGDTARSLLAQQNTDGSLLVVASDDRNQIGSTISLDTNPVIGERVVMSTDEAITGLSPVVQATTRVPGDPGWISIIEVDESEVYAELETVRTRLITIFIGAGLVVLMVVVFAVRGFVRRLGRISELARSVAKGDLTVRTNDEQDDELGRLSTAFDNMAQALAEDIAQRERVEAQLAFQATHDALTGLPNRTQLVEQLDMILSEGAQSISCLFVDLDGFKAVNDSLGHGAGDELLIRVGQRLSDVLRPGDFLARLGGDEFVVILKGLGAIDAERLAGRVVAALELPFMIANQEVSISASIGVASASETHTTERLIREADIGMYRAKAKGRGRAVRVTDETLAEVDERVSILGELREAAQNDELQLMLLPMGDMRDGSLRGVETAVRWHHPTRGVIAPSEFNKMVRDSGTATQIDEWVIVRATELFAKWRDEKLPIADLEMSINLHPAVFTGSRSRQLLSSEIGRRGLRPVNFRVEVSESVLKNDPDSLREVFDTYRAIGVPVTLDSFGSEYSNMELLPRFAIDAVKIDLGQIADVSNRLSSHALISSLITLAQTAGLRVTATGVDDPEMREQLIQLGVVWGQGNWFSMPIEEDDFLDVLERRHLLGSS